MEQEAQMIQGTVLAIVYQNPENGYCVLKIRAEDGQVVTVVGTIPMCVAGERLAIVGKWSRHPSFGQQFEAEFLERLMPESASEILAFLSSRAIKGIGPKTAEKIVSRFGVKSLEILEQDHREKGTGDVRELPEAVRHPPPDRISDHVSPAGAAGRAALPGLWRACAGGAAG